MYLVVAESKCYSLTDDIDCSPSLTPQYLMTAIRNDGSSIASSFSNGGVSLSGDSVGLRNKGTFVDNDSVGVRNVTLDPGNSGMCAHNNNVRVALNLHSVTQCPSWSSH